MNKRLVREKKLGIILNFLNKEIIILLKISLTQKTEDILSEDRMQHEKEEHPEIGYVCIFEIICITSLHGHLKN